MSRRTKKKHHKVKRRAKPNPTAEAKRALPRNIWMRGSVMVSPGGKIKIKLPGRGRK